MKNNTVFAVGDVVQLKSPSPAMTVESLSLGVCNCVWFDDAFKVNRASFNDGTLKAAEFEQEQQCGECDGCLGGCANDDDDDDGDINNMI